MSQFADMPVLTVGEVPEFDRFRRIKIRSIDDMWYKQPVTDYASRIRTFPLDAMSQNIIRMRADKSDGKKV